MYFSQLTRAQQFVANNDLLLGADGGIDFDAVRVFEESKQSCVVKNKGKYDISYS